MNKKRKEDKWYVELFVGVLGLYLAYLLFVDYEKYIVNKDMPFGRNAKLFRVIALYVYKMDGTIYFIIFIFIISAIIILLAIKKAFKNRI